MWIKNSSGKKDAMLTFATIAFGGQTRSFQILDSGTMTAYLAATFGAYVSRRWTDRKFIDSKQETDKEE